MLLIYSALCLGLQIVSWRVDSIAATAVCATLMGFLLGPFFAAVSFFHVLKAGYHITGDIVLIAISGHDNGEDVDSSKDLGAIAR